MQQGVGGMQRAGLRAADQYLVRVNGRIAQIHNGLKHREKLVALQEFGQWPLPAGQRQNPRVVLTILSIGRSGVTACA